MGREPRTSCILGMQTLCHRATLPASLEASAGTLTLNYLSKFPFCFLFKGSDLLELRMLALNSVCSLALGLQSSCLSMHSKVLLYSVFRGCQKCGVYNQFLARPIKAVQ